MNNKTSLTLIITLTIVFTLFKSNLSLAQDDKSFLQPPRLIKYPVSSLEYAVENRKFSGISSLAVSRNGRLWTTWYAGITPGEDKNNYVVVATSGDNGVSWEEILIIDPIHDQVRAYDSQIWFDPEGHLWVFWAQSIAGKMSVHYNGINAGVWAITAQNPDINNPEWSEPKRLTEGVMMCKPIVLSDGEWLLPVSTWRTYNSAKVVVSTDLGKSFHVRGAVNVPEAVWNADEHMVVERKDGSLWMLVRTRYGIGQSISKDRGRTWSPLIPAKIQHSMSRFFITRLNSGNLLLVKHGPIDMETGKLHSGRSHLMAFISRDEGHSWSNGLLLDERDRVSYPDGQQAIDGTIYITYDYDRLGNQNIFLTSFRENDVISGSDISIYETYLRRRLISKGGE